MVADDVETRRRDHPLELRRGLGPAVAASHRAVRHELAWIQAVDLVSEGAKERAQRGRRGSVVGTPTTGVAVTPRSGSARHGLGLVDRLPHGDRRVGGVATHDVANPLRVGRHPRPACLRGDRLVAAGVPRRPLPGGVVASTVLVAQGEHQVHPVQVGGIDRLVEGPPVPNRCAARSGGRGVGLEEPRTHQGVGRQAGEEGVEGAWRPSAPPAAPVDPPLRRELIGVDSREVPRLERGALLQGQPAVLHDDRRVRVKRGVDECCERRPLPRAARCRDGARISRGKSENAEQHDDACKEAAHGHVLWEDGEGEPPYSRRNSCLP